MENNGGSKYGLCRLMGCRATVGRAYFGVGGAGTADETSFVAEAASVDAHLHSVEFGIKQDKRVRPERGKKKRKEKVLTPILKHYQTLC